MGSGVSVVINIHSEECPTGNLLLIWGGFATGDLDAFGKWEIYLAFMPFKDEQNGFMIGVDKSSEGKS